MEELKKASQFKDDMPRCEIVVDGITVVANTVSSTSSVSSESNSNNVLTLTTSSSTEAPIYQEVTSSQSGASAGSDNIEDQQEVEVNHDGDGDQSSSSGGEGNNGVDGDGDGDPSSSAGGAENNEDEATNSIEDNDIGNVSGGNEAASDETNTDNQALDSTATVDENTFDESPNPLHLFDMTDCGTFSALWMWDLALTCSNSTSLDSCSCTAAKIHIQYGDIDCMNDECPPDCPVCDMCMKLSGCVPNTELHRGADIDGGNTDAVPIAFIGLTAAFFGIQLVLFKVYWGSRTQPGGTLESQLL